MPPEKDDHVQGVDVDDVQAVLDEISFPITVAELIDRHGDREIERTNAEPISIRALFDGIGDDTYESSDEFQQMVLNLMPRDSVGREEYSDRGGSHPVETREADRQDPDESV